MYKIIFNPSKCQWEIKLLSFGFLWVTLKGKTFPNHDSAVDYIDQVGLDKVYHPAGKSFFTAVVEGGV